MLNAKLTPRIEAKWCPVFEHVPSTHPYQLLKGYQNSFLKLYWLFQHTHEKSLHAEIFTKTQHRLCTSDKTDVIFSNTMK